MSMKENPPVVAGFSLSGPACQWRDGRADQTRNRQGPEMSDRSKGIWSMIAVCVAWGLSPLFYRGLSHVAPAEVLAHRTLWSLILFAIVLAGQGRLAALPRTLAGPHLGRLIVAAGLISTNWGLYIWSVQNGHVVESSLGYYIFPLVAVVMGVVVFRETLSPAQWLAVALAALAVVVLSWGLGAAPWISLSLALTFGSYGVIKKALPVGPVLSVAAEVAVLAPLALVWLTLSEAGVVAVPGRAHFSTDLYTALMLMLSGPVTALPLILFARATRLVDLATVGVVGYLNPTLQFLCAVLLMGETFTVWHAAAFALIWAALAIYSGAAMQRVTRA